METQNAFVVLPVNKTLPAQDNISLWRLSPLSWTLAMANEDILTSPAKLFWKIDFISFSSVVP